MAKCSPHETLPRFGRIGSHYTRLLLTLRSALLIVPLRLTPKASSQSTRLSTRYTVYYSSVPVESRLYVLAPSIFRADCFGTWVFTHSLADDDFHVHRRAVNSHQHLLCDLNERIIWHLNSTFGSSRIASSAYQKWPTWHNTFAYKHQLSMSILPTRSQFENEWRTIAPRAPNHSLYNIELHFVPAILRETSKETSY